MQPYGGPPPGYDEPDAVAQIFRWGPGKSGPRLVQDLCKHGLNPDQDALTRFPTSLLEEVLPGVKHSWIIDLLHNEEFDNARILRACCEYTRVHVEMSIDYANDENVPMTQHCLWNAKLHHFQMLPDESTHQPGQYNSFAWTCSRCPTALVMRIRAPEVPASLLQNLYAIRPQSSFSRPTGKIDAAKPSRFSTLFGLEYLLRNTAAFNTENRPGQVPREIAFVSGSMFEQRVGHERAIIELMKCLMFTFCPADHEPGDYIDEDMAADEMETDGVDWVFRPANPAQLGIRSRYRRMRLEMQILAWKAREDLNDVHRERPWFVKHIRAEPYMRKVLDAERSLYSSDPACLSVDENTAEEPCYHKLGIVADAMDKIIIDFYGLQSKHDQRNSSHYLTAMEAIARKRNSAVLLIELQRQKSMGAYTRQDLHDAYAQILASEVPIVDVEAEAAYMREDDETLINIAASIMMDNESSKHKIRQALSVIASDRDSGEIRRYLNTPDRDFADVEAALRYLGAENSTEDDFLIVLYDLKVEENSELAKSALQTIADDRKNVRLRRFLDTGDRSAMPTVSFTHPKDATDMDMLDPDLAYSRLGVDDRTTDDEMLMMLYEIRAADDPDDAAQLRKALELLGDMRKSDLIKHYLKTGSKEVVPYKPPEASVERPVGLENIGNTCYLNSLLQYYFTIKPLRNAILNHETIIEESADEEVLKRKKVGGRLVSREEVERALRFLRELRNLFRLLINCERASLKPTRAVCFLALVSQRDEAAQKKINLVPSDTSRLSQLTKGEGVSLESSGDNQLVLHNPIAAEKLDFGNFGFEEETTSKRKASAEILVGREPSLVDLEPARSPSPTSLSQTRSDLFDTRSDLTGGRQTLNQEDTNDHSTDLVEISVADTRHSPDLVEHIEHSEAIEQSASSLIDAPELPSTQRPGKRRQSSLLWSETNDWGRQQDVAECIDNVLFQLEAAFKPTSFDLSGEQVDLLKDLFYGVTKQTLNMPGNEPKYERFSNTIITLEKDGQDIYHALDGVFDLRQVELGGQQINLNLTVDQAPPILQIQIQRVGFDLKSMSAVKSNIYLALDQSIFLDRYLETDDPTMNEERQQYWQWKQQIAQVSVRREEIQTLLNNIELVGMQEQHSPQHQQNDHLWSATEAEVNSDDEEDETTATLRRGSVREVDIHDVSVVHKEEEEDETTIPALSKEELERDLRAVEAEERDLSYRLSQAFKSYRAHEYRLHSVFIHRGEASHGHYWVYIYDFVRDKWRKYNDEEVSDVLREEIMRDRTGDNENPYMLSYVRADQLHLTDALERDLEKVWEEDSLL